MSAYNRYNDQSRSHGLPGDEYSRLRKRDCLNTHFEHRGNRDAPYPELTRSAYRDAGLFRESRVRVSETRNATRAALGGSFDFTDDGYERSRRREDDYQRSRGWIDDAPRRAPIPQKYQDEFNRLWNEDDEANDAYQYRSDSSRDAPWREHVALECNRLDVSRLPTRRPETSYATSRNDSGYGSSGSRRLSTPPRVRSPELVSRFSFGSVSDSYKEPPRRRRHLGLFGRDQM
jgi:hypothetical protein